MKKINKKSAQTDGSGGAKMSVEDQAVISRLAEQVKKRIGNLEDRLHELRQRTKSFDPDDVPCAIDMEICRIEQAIDKEYAKIDLSMTSLSDKKKEAWR